MFDAASAPPIDAERLGVGCHNIAFGYVDRMSPFGVMVAVAFAIAYGLFFFKRGPSLLKTVVKTGAVLALALASVIDRDPWLLTLALMLCAAGDAFLAGDPKRWLPWGMGAFLAGHLVYVTLFVVTLIAIAQSKCGFAGDGKGLAPGPGQIGVMIGAGLGAAAMLRWLWPSLGGLRLPVLAYVLTIVTMVCTVMVLPWQGYFSARIGAVAFFLSDAVLSVQLFKHRFEGRFGQWTVWGLYFVGQVLITAGFTGDGVVTGRLF